MKKTISAILSALILVTSIPAFAADKAVAPIAVGEPNPTSNSGAATKEGLESAIKSVKALLPIPETFNKFEYQMSNDGGKEMWNLSWNSENQDGSAYAMIDGKGNILNYSMYKREDYDPVKKLPKITRQEAEKIADDFIEKIAPDYISIIKKSDNNSSSESYTINYSEVHNDIMFSEAGINLIINPQTGDITNYNCSINPENAFPKPENIINLKQAQEAYKTEIGMKLIYKSFFDQDDLKVYLAYVPKYEQDYAIDAFTGKKIKLNDGYYPYYGGMRNEMMMKSASLKMDIPMTPEEMEAVENLSGLISKADAEKKARELGKDLGLKSDYKLENFSLNREYPLKQKLVWRLSFILSDKKNGDSYFSIVFDAKTGEFIRFDTNRYSPSSKTPEAKYGVKEAKSASDAFIKKYLGAKASNFEYFEQFSDSQLKIADVKPTQISVLYNRLVNGIPFPDNSISIQYDAVDGKIISYNLNWYDVEFKDANGVMAVDKISDNFFSNVGLALQYQSSNITNNMDYSKTGNKRDIKLVYTTDRNVPTTLDPYTGEIIDYDGKPYKKERKIEYSDISGHYAENAITEIAQLGIGFDDKEYKPDLTMEQKDFLWLLSKTSNEYYNPRPMDMSDKKELDNMYKTLLARGVIKDGEVAPDTLINREDAVKFIIRALKLESVATLSGIWNCPFSDKETFEPTLIGFATLAYGMGIVKGGSEMEFSPKLTLTRGQAAIIIYNFLGRK